MFPASDEEIEDDFPQDTSMCVAWSGQDTVMPQLIWYTIDWLGTRKYTENWWQCPGPGSHFLYSPLPKPHMGPQITWEGESGFFPDTKYVVFLQPPIPNTQQAAQYPLSLDTISVELVPMPQIEVSRLPRLQIPAMCSRVIMFLNKWLKLEISTLPPCSKTQSNQWTNSGKLIHCSQRNSETVKWRRS